MLSNIVMLLLLTVLTFLRYLTILKRSVLLTTVTVRILSLYKHT